MTTPIKPWHSCPPCHDCDSPVASPQACSGNHGAVTDPAALYCPACGATWSELNPFAVARAWWAVGAYAAKQTIEGEPVAHVPPWPCESD